VVETFCFSTCLDIFSQVLSSKEVVLKEAMAVARLEKENMLVIIVLEPKVLADARDHAMHVCTRPSTVTMPLREL
jgi:hypothetical protein